MAFYENGNYKYIVGNGEISLLSIEGDYKWSDFNEVAKIEFYENKKINSIIFEESTTTVQVEKTNYYSYGEDEDYEIKSEEEEKVSYPNIYFFGQRCEIKEVQFYSNGRLKEIDFNTPYQFSFNNVYEMIFYENVETNNFDNSQQNSFSNNSKILFLSTGDGENDWIKVIIGEGYDDYVNAKQVLFYYDGCPFYVLIKGNNKNLLNVLKDYKSFENIKIKQSSYNTGEAGVFATSLGNIRAREAFFYPGNKVCILICDGVNYVDTSLGAFGVRALSFYENGNIRNIELSEVETVQTPLGKIDVDYIEWDEKGKLKKVRYVGDKKISKYKYGDFISF